MTSTKPTEALDAFFRAARANDVEGVDAVFARVERTDARRAVRVDARDARGHLATHHAAALGNLGGPFGPHEPPIPSNEWK